MVRDLKYGTLTGMGIITLILFEFSMGWDRSPLLRNTGIIPLLMLTSGIYYGIRAKRDRDLEGVIGYKHAATTGIMISFITAIIAGGFSYYYIADLNPSLPEIMIREKQELLQRLGASGEKINEQIYWLRKEYSPAGQMIISFAGLTIVGSVLSLIFSVFLHRRLPAGE